jgi:hypothetical protein
VAAAPSALPAAADANLQLVVEPGRAVVRRADHPHAAPLGPPSVAELAADRRAWIQAWNHDPTPFVWAKTAAEILDNLTR